MILYVFSFALSSYGLWSYLQDFRNSNEAHLKKLPCQMYDPIPLGEGAGVGLMKGVDSMTMPQGSTLDDLVKTGIDHTHAAVGVLIHLRKELSLVKDIPVLIAIDQVTNMFPCAYFDIHSLILVECILYECVLIFYNLLEF